MMTDVQGFEKVELDPRSASRKRWLIAAATLLLMVILAVTCALVVRYFVITTFYVNGSSMYPTLSGGDDNVPDDGDVLYLNKLAKIKRGDIIVFTPDWLTDDGETYRTLVKRVIGVGGDRVQIINNLLYLNGELVNESYIAEPMNTSDLDVIVPDGHIFCMGDNRNNSADSRYYGCAPLDCVHGKCFLVRRNGKLRKP